MLADNQHRVTDPVTRLVGRFAVFFQLKCFRIETFRSNDIGCGQCNYFNRLESKGGTFQFSFRIYPTRLLSSNLERLMPGIKDSP